ncbi:MAG TPA: preprotein translocase subunit YajC [Acidimicrobiales bacterium]|jgi:preprotein translocase subunit YajC|nr:preprotein translocase subunit YajC [Acidimicrobiales bacterium]
MHASLHLLAAQIVAATTPTTKAGAAKSTGSSSYTPLIFVVLIIGVYFLFIRPRSQKARQAQQVKKQFELGDDVVSIGGITGRVVGFDDDEVEVEVASGVNLTFLRRAVNARNPAPAPNAGGRAGGTPSLFGRRLAQPVPSPSQDSGFEDSEYDDSDFEESGFEDPELDHSGTADTEFEHSGIADTEATEPEVGHSDPGASTGHGAGPDAGARDEGHDGVVGADGALGADGAVGEAGHGGDESEPEVGASPGTETGGVSSSGAIVNRSAGGGSGSRRRRGKRPGRGGGPGSATGGR